MASHCLCTNKLPAHPGDEAYYCSRKCATQDAMDTLCNGARDFGHKKKFVYMQRLVRNFVPPKGHYRKHARNMPINFEAIAMQKQMQENEQLRIYYQRKEAERKLNKANHPDDDADSVFWDSPVPDNGCFPSPIMAIPSPKFGDFPDFASATCPSPMPSPVFSAAPFEDAASETDEGERADDEDEAGQFYYRDSDLDSELLFQDDDPIEHALAKHWRSTFRFDAGYISMGESSESKFNRPINTLSLPGEDRSLFSPSLPEIPSFTALPSLDSCASSITSAEDSEDEEDPIYRRDNRAYDEYYRPPIDPRTLPRPPPHMLEPFLASKIGRSFINGSPVIASVPPQPARAVAITPQQKPIRKMDKYEELESIGSYKHPYEPDPSTFPMPDFTTSTFMRPSKSSSSVATTSSSHVSYHWDDVPKVEQDRILRESAEWVRKNWLAKPEAPKVKDTDRKHLVAPNTATIRASSIFSPLMIDSPAMFHSAFFQENDAPRQDPQQTPKPCLPPVFRESGLVSTDGYHWTVDQDFH